MLLPKIIPLALILFISIVCGDVSISSPTSGQTYTVSDGTVSVEVEWIDSGADPSLSDVESYTFTLCTGSNTDIDPISTLDTVSASSLSSYAYNASIDASAGASGEYFIQVYAAYSDGYTIHYTDRFTLDDMTGSKEPSGSGDSPDAQTSISDTTTTDTSAVDTSASFSITYTLQTGRTRYAPMQQQPGTTITATTWSRRFPTSAVTYYTTLEPSPNVWSTITPGWSYTMSSLVNYATPALDPSENGGWYAASEKLKSASYSSISGATITETAKKRKRWDVD
ncbi:hypothetical protein PACTADRAFT_50939 [Pachysolen tannophilus NRRL Y-2460]|uniref:Uncharacterized protein n=1 Tax=Pachysolen tannophilus NRRL Y-2460 TaxID=669874 RepID=A0A1E4TQM7_PACTA|nr:hypothetical protein PACTADRAFT_50939 [Pachysolen tannophilus NRRL Y-2460]